MSISHTQRLGAARGKSPSSLDPGNRPIWRNSMGVQAIYRQILRYLLYALTEGLFSRNDALQIQLLTEPFRADSIEGFWASSRAWTRLASVLQDTHVKPANANVSRRSMQLFQQTLGLLSNEIPELWDCNSENYRAARSPSTSFATKTIRPIRCAVCGASKLLHM